MAKLLKHKLGYDKAQQERQLRNGSKQVVQNFDTSAEALQSGVLEKAAGGNGSAQIRKPYNII